MFNKSIRSRIMEKLAPVIEAAEQKYKEKIIEIDKAYFDTIKSAEEIRKEGKVAAADDIINNLF